MTTTEAEAILDAALAKGMAKRAAGAAPPGVLDNLLSPPTLHTERDRTPYQDPAWGTAQKAILGTLGGAGLGLGSSLIDKTQRRRWLHNMLTGAALGGGIGGGIGAAYHYGTMPKDRPVNPNPPGPVELATGYRSGESSWQNTRNVADRMLASNVGVPAAAALGVAGGGIGLASDAARRSSPGQVDARILQLGNKEHVNQVGQPAADVLQRLQQGPRQPGMASRVMSRVTGWSPGVIPQGTGPNAITPQQYETLRGAADKANPQGYSWAPGRGAFGWRTGARVGIPALLAPLLANSAARFIQQ